MEYLCSKSNEPKTHSGHAYTLQHSTMMCVFATVAVWMITRTPSEVFETERAVSKGVTVVQTRKISFGTVIKHFPHLNLSLEVAAPQRHTT